MEKKITSDHEVAVVEGRFLAKIAHAEKEVPSTSSSSKHHGRGYGGSEDHSEDWPPSSDHEVAVADGRRLAKRDDPTDSSRNNAILEYKLQAKWRSFRIEAANRRIEDDRLSEKWRLRRLRRSEQMNAFFKKR